MVGVSSPRVERAGATPCGSVVIFWPPVRGRWPLPEGGKLRRSLPAPYLRPPPKKCGAGAHAASLAPLFWADLHAITWRAATRRVALTFLICREDLTDGPLCERWAAEAQLLPVCARRRETPISSRRAHRCPNAYGANVGVARGLRDTTRRCEPALDRS